MYTKEYIKSRILKEIDFEFLSEYKDDNPDPDHYLFVDNDSEVIIYTDMDGTINTLDVMEFHHISNIENMKNGHIIVDQISIESEEDVYKTRFLLIDRTRDEKQSITFLVDEELFVDTTQFENVRNDIVKEYPRERPYNRFYNIKTELDQFIDDTHDYIILEHI